MNARQIKAAKHAGNSNWEILKMLVSAGREFPDASFAVKHALGLDMEETEQMELDYDECS